MTIDIHDTALEARLRKQIQSTGAASAEEALQRYALLRRGLCLVAGELRWYLRFLPTTSLGFGGKKGEQRG